MDVIIEKNVGIQEIPKSDIPELIKLLVLNAQLPFGILKNSASDNFHISICSPASLVSISDVLEISPIENKSGFIAFPFDEKEGYFIPSEIDAFELFELSKIGYKKEFNPDSNFQSTNKTFFESAVSKAIQEIKLGKFEKLVLGRKKEVNFSFDSLEPLIKSLISNYSEANICFFYFPKDGFWISASPEILVEKKKGAKEMETMALAGTKAYNGQDIRNQGWAEKEIEEQALVSRFIKEQLKYSNFLNYEEKGPITIQAGNILHLRTDFKIKADFSFDFLRIAKSLHPTSAVCGSPRTAAMNWILENEDYERNFFTGFAGIISPDFGKLIVILRCGKIESNKITLYAGAGVTSNSIPNNEWEETQDKLQTLGRFLLDS